MGFYCVNKAGECIGCLRCVDCSPNLFAVCELCGERIQTGYFDPYEQKYFCGECVKSHFDKLYRGFSTAEKCRAFDIWEVDSR